MVRRYVADLHLHSVLSPCGDLSMSPATILECAQEAGLDLIALTDHNMVENGAALRDLAAGGAVSVLYGMELETIEEVHLLCLFDHLTDAMDWQEYVYARLPDIPNDPDHFGDQVVVDAAENILRLEERLLANAAAIPLVDACIAVGERGGLAIPAHVDRAAHSLVSQLGFPPDGMPLEAVELSRFATQDFLQENAYWMGNLPLVRFSDAHFPAEVGQQRTAFHLETACVSEIRRALRGEGGRSVTPA